MRRTVKPPKYRCKKVRGKKHGVVTINGTDFYCGPHGSKTSLNEYDRIVAEYLASGRSKDFGQPEPVVETIKMAELIRRFGIYAKGYHVRKDGTQTGVHHNMKPLMRTLNRLYGKIPVEEWRQEQFQAFINYAARNGFGEVPKNDENGEALSQRSLGDAMGHIKKMFKWANQNGLAGVEHEQAIKNVTLQRRGRATDEVEAVPDEFVDLALPHMPEMVADMCRLQMVSGMRPGEVIAITKGQIEFGEDDWVYKPKNHKNAHRKKSRSIPLVPAAQQILDKYLGAEDEPCFSPAKSIEMQRARRSAERVVPLSCGTTRKKNAENRGGDYYSAGSYRKAVQRAQEKVFYGKVGFKWSPNQIRHRVGEKLQDAVGIEAVLQVHGHSDLKTSRRYAKENTKLAAAALRKIS